MQINEFDSFALMRLLRLWIKANFIIGMDVTLLYNGYNLEYNECSSKVVRFPYQSARHNLNSQIFCNNKN
jgi:hypothetical protein